MRSFLYTQLCGLIHTLNLNSTLELYVFGIVSVSLGGLRCALPTIKCKVSLQQQRVILSHVIRLLWVLLTGYPS